MQKSNQEIIIYNADDGKTKVALMARDDNAWLNQNQLAAAAAAITGGCGGLLKNVIFRYRTIK